MLDSKSHIAPHLPALRRYAGALTGDQKSGDIFVAAMLEVLLGDPVKLRVCQDSRITLHRELTLLWQSVIANPEAESENNKNTGTNSATTLPQIHDAAYILLNEEGFKPLEIYQILGHEVIALQILENSCNNMEARAA